MPFEKVQGMRTTSGSILSSLEAVGNIAETCLSLDRALDGTKDTWRRPGRKPELQFTDN